MSDLIDTTEMYLRTIYELVEEGIVPLRARIAERLHQSGPTVSQTVARMERDGLLTVEGDRPSNDAIERIDRRATIPRDISSRSDNVNASRERRRGAGLIPPYGASWK